MRYIIDEIGEDYVLVSRNRTTKTQASARVSWERERRNFSCSLRWHAVRELSAATLKTEKN